MNELEKLRGQIDALDEQMLHLFEQRMQVSKQIAAYKQAHSTNVLQTGREDVVRAHAAQAMQDQTLASHAVSFINGVMDISKDYQHECLHDTVWQDCLPRAPFDKEGTVGYFGEVGSNTEQAMSEWFGTACKHTVAIDSFEGVFRAIENGSIRYGVVPIENSSTGAIDDVYDLLGKYNAYVIGEHWLRIRHALWSKQGVAMSQIRSVYSHPQALAQCRAYLQEKGWEVHASTNTAAAAMLVAQSSDPTQAAIAGVRAGERLGLQCMARDIQTCNHNYTRFVIIAKELPIGQEADKVSLRFALYSASGTLYRALRYFARYGINMISLASRPVAENPCNYWFYVDLEGNLQQDNMRRALGVLQENTTSMRVLGEYRRGKWQCDTD